MLVVSRHEIRIRLLYQNNPSVSAHLCNNRSQAIDQLVGTSENHRSICSPGVQYNLRNLLQARIKYGIIFFKFFSQMSCDITHSFIDLSIYCSNYMDYHTSPQRITSADCLLDARMLSSFSSNPLDHASHEQDDVQCTTDACNTSFVHKRRSQPTPERRVPEC